MDKVNLARAFSRFEEKWQPKIVGEVNEVQVKVVKLEGAFIWHRHPGEDELFLVVAGRLRMQLRDREIEMEPGELLVVPRGVEHRPVAEEEVHVLLVEPKSTVNTGDAGGDRTAPEAWL